ncbi:unnamed protein product [Colias eurytheme]|nr:unnamed protein product [Colias eurytheme]
MRPAVEKEVRGACGGGGGPAWNEMPRDLRPACNTLPPHTSRATETAAGLTDEWERRRETGIRIRLRGVVRCVMQACVLCARWTCNDGRSFR